MEIFKLLGRIAIQTDEAQKNLDEIEAKAHSTEGKLSKAFEKIGKASIACGKAIAAGLAVGTAAFTALTTKAMNLAGELEQNMGGAAAVFGEYASKMEETAKTAFSSMGLSASDFLATANKMGSLFKGAGFDTAEAADLTAEAMQRAADVASIMGIDVSVAMESIAGAAKGNFTMMDNLGVAMNDTNLQAYALAKGINKSTQEMTSQEKISLAMQMFLEKTADYAGNYAKENDTLAGSLTTAKAALKNFLSGAGDASQLADALVSSGKVISQKLLGLLPSLVSGIGSLCNALIPELPSLLQTLLPAVVDGAVALIEGLVGASGALVSALMGLVPDLMSGAARIMEAIGSALLADGNIEFILDSALQIVTMLAQGLINNLDKIADAACTLVERLGDWISKNASVIVESGVMLIAKLGATLVREIPKLISAAAKALAKSLPAIVKSFGEVFSKLDGLEKVVVSLVAAFLAFKGVMAIISVIKAVKAAFMSLSATMAANPIGMVVGAVSGLAAAFGVLSLSLKENRNATISLTKYHMDLRDRIAETTSEMYNAMDAHEEKARLIAYETEETEDLWKELQNLADESGYVDDANRDRAEHILGELNDALETEYGMNGNIIGQYQQMQEEIGNLIKMRQAERLLKDAETGYIGSVSSHNTAVENAKTTETAWNYTIGTYEGMMADHLETALSMLTPEQRDEIIRLAEGGTSGYDLFSKSAGMSTAYNYMRQLFPAAWGDDNLEARVNALAELLPAYDAYVDARESLDASNKIIADYEAAEMAIAVGDYSTAIELLTDKTSQLWSTVERGEEISSQSANALRGNLETMLWEIEDYTKKLDAGVDGYTEETLRDLEANYRERQKLWSQYNALHRDDSPQQYTEIGAADITASEIELTPVKIDDDTRASVDKLRGEITRLTDAIAGMIAGGFKFELNRREIGRLVRAEVK